MKTTMNNRKTHQSQIPTSYTRTDGISVDISELIRGGVRFGDVGETADPPMPMSIEEMWKALEKALKPPSNETH